jgi:hypothetical protein
LICVTDRPDLDERFEELVRLVAERATAPAPAAIRRRAWRRLAGQGVGAVLLALALVAAGLAVDRRLGAAPAPAGPAAPSTSTPSTSLPSTGRPRTSAPPTSLAPVPQAVMRPGAPGSGLIASGTSPKGMAWRLKARLAAGRGLCDNFQVAAPGTPVDQGASGEGCMGPEKDVTLSFSDTFSPGNPEVAVNGVVAGRAAKVALTLKHQPRDHRSPVAGTVTVRPIHAPGFQVGFFVTFIPTDTWVAAVTLYDAGGSRICSQLGDDFKTPYLPGAMRCT